MKKFMHVMNYMMIAAIAVSATVFSSCNNDDDPIAEAPTVTGPTSVTSVQVGTAGDVSFTVTVPGGYKSSALTATGGTVVAKSEPAAGATTGTVVGTFTADNSSGAAVVNLTVIDNNNKTATQTAAVNKSISAPPSIALDKTEVEAKPGETVVVTVTITAANGSKTLTVTSSNGATINPASPIDLSGATSKEVCIGVPAEANVGSTVGAVFSASDTQDLNSSVVQITITVVDPRIQITGPITADAHWTADKQYLLKGNVYVQSGATLTIDAGTVVFGDKLTKGALIIDRGAKINAAGTAQNPIIFTSSAPANFRNYGDWGGVVLLGKATNNQSENQTIEGVSAPTGDDGKYGGSADDDNSGTLQYARIEFAGIALSTDNELNGLTFGSVGSGTTIDHIQVSYSGDDSYEWFGGAVNARYLIAYRGWDDDFDTDFGYHGTVQYGVAFRDPNISDKSGSNGFESDNDANGSALTPKTHAILANITWYGPHVYSKPKTNGAAGAYTAQIDNGTVGANYGFGAHIRRNSDLRVYNSIFVGSKLEGVHFDKTGAAAEFKGNYFARIGSGTATVGTIKKVTTGNSYDDSNFDADNITDGVQTAFDQSAILAGMKYNGDVNTKFSNSMNIDQPSALLAANSILINNAKIATVPAGVDQTTYIGAFDSTNDWANASWTNYSPNATEY